MWAERVNYSAGKTSICCALRHNLSNVLMCNIGWTHSSLPPILLFTQLTKCENCLFLLIIICMYVYVCRLCESAGNILSIAFCWWRFKVTFVNFVDFCYNNNIECICRTLSISHLNGQQFNAGNTFQLRKFKNIFKWHQHQMY